VKNKVKLQLTVVTPKNTDYIMPAFEAVSIKFDTDQTTIPPSIKN